MKGDERPMAIMVHPSMRRELEFRKETFEKETGRKAFGGMTAYSEMAAAELRAIRKSGEEIYSEILKVQEIRPIRMQHQGALMEFVPYEFFKKVFIYSSVLRRRKDGPAFRMEIHKLKGLKKNEYDFHW